MAVKVEQCVLSKSGKAWRVMLGGQWYNAFKDSGIDQQIGKMIEAEIQTHDKFGPSIVAWKPSSVAAPQGSPPPASPPAGPAAAAPVYASTTAKGSGSTQPQYAEPSDNVSPWWAPFMSNMCAHAIQAGLCKAPEQLNQWALKAAQVAVAVKDEVKR